MARTITEFLPELAVQLPVTADLLHNSRLVIHDAVCQITLLGSRGLANTYRPDSDIDLSLMVDVTLMPKAEPERADFLRTVLEITLSQWQSPVDVDLAAVFDKGDCCGMRCFNQLNWNDAVIANRGEDCFGIYKMQRGFNSYVTQGVRLAPMYPMLAIWRQPTPP